MSYADALADLKADFGKKKLLTPAEIAPYICKSASAQASMRSRKQFPIAQKDMGGRVVVSIYALARYIGEEDEEVAPPKPAPVTQPAKATAKTAKGIDKTKPIRRPPSLGKTLTAFRKRVMDTALQLQFQQTLFAEIEACIMDMTAASGRSKKGKTA
ncbi:MAG: hypothetical protein Q7T39_00175 [Polaromonas sp.]|nr:hypothetical protein [Polaromonas sp.]